MYLNNFYCFRRSCLVRVSGRTTVGRWVRPWVTSTPLLRTIITVMTLLRPKTPRWAAGDTPEVTGLITTRPREAGSPATRNTRALEGGGAQEKYSRSSSAQHSLQRGRDSQPPGSTAYPMGYSSFDRRGGGAGHGGMMASMPSSNPDYPPPDHYFMKSQRKYSGEELRVYVDYNK